MANHDVNTYTEKVWLLFLYVAGLIVKHDSFVANRNRCSTSNANVNIANQLKSNKMGVNILTASRTQTFLITRFKLARNLCS